MTPTPASEDGELRDQLKRHLEYETHGTSLREREAFLWVAMRIIATQKRQWQYDILDKLDSEAADQPIEVLSALLHHYMSELTQVNKEEL